VSTEAQLVNGGMEMIWKEAVRA